LKAKCEFLLPSPKSKARYDAIFGKAAGSLMTYGRSDCFVVRVWVRAVVDASVRVELPFVSQPLTSSRTKSSGTRA
jgi:hypothetical protein